MRVATLLTLAPAMLPLLCPVKLAAALVLLPVSAANVVVALKGVLAVANSEEDKISASGKETDRYNGSPRMRRPRDDGLQPSSISMRGLSLAAFGAF